MKRSLFYQVIGTLFTTGHEAEAIVLAGENWLEKIVKNPETGNMVKVKSLPDRYKDRYRPKRKKSEDVKKSKRPKKVMHENDSKKELNALKNIKKQAIDNVNKQYKIQLEDADKETRKKILRKRGRHRREVLKSIEEKERLLEKNLGINPLKGKKISKDKMGKVKEEQSIKREERKERSAEEKQKKAEIKEWASDPADISIFKDKKPSDMGDEDIFDFIMAIKDKAGF